MNINATLFLQWIPFFILVLVTAKFIWPPVIKALDERAHKIRVSLESADKAKGDAAALQESLKAQMQNANSENAQRIADAERRAQQLIEEAKAKATEEGNKIIATAKAEAEQQAVQVRETLREQVSSLAIKGAEQILRKEVNASSHADLLKQLAAQL